MACIPTPLGQAGDHPRRGSARVTLPACTCGAEAAVFVPGSVTQFRTEYGPDGKPMFRSVSVEAYETRAWCLPCAQADGWPWLESETSPTPLTPA